MKKLSQVLIGSGYSKTNKNQFSKLILGNIRDKDKDSAITGFSKWVDDCKPNNPKRQGPLEDARAEQQSNIQTLGNQISIMSQRAEEIKKQINESRGDVSGLQNEYANILDRQNILSAALRGWMEGGQSYADYYSAQVNAEQQGREAAEKQKNQPPAEPSRLELQSQLNELARQGVIPKGNYKPVYVGGKLTGYETGTMSIPVERFNAWINKQTIQPQPQLQLENLPQSQLPQTPQSTLTKAPTLKERYMQNVESAGGWISGTMRFIGGEFARQEDISQQKAARRGDTSAFYQSQPLLNFAYAAPQIAIYSSPLGPAIMTGEGYEKLFTKRGIAATNRRAEELSTQYNLPKFWGGVAARGEAVVELGAGLYGLKIQGENVLSKFATNNPKTIFIATETPQGEFTNVNVLSKTTMGKTNTFGLSEQRVKTFGDTNLGVSRGFIIPEGDVSQAAIESGKIKKFISAGTSKVSGEAQLTKDLGVMKLKQSAGQGIISKSTTKIQGEPNLIKQEVLGVVRPNQEETIFQFLGGETSKMRFYKNPSKMTKLAKPSISGYIVRIVEEEPKTFSMIPAKTKTSGLTTAVQESVTSQVSSLISKAKAQAPVNIPKKSALPLVSGLTQQEPEPRIQPSQYSGLGLYERTEGGISPLLQTQNQQIKLNLPYIQENQLINKQFIEPKVNLLFAQPQLIKTFLQPELNKVFAQPSLSSVFIKPEVKLRMENVILKLQLQPEVSVTKTKQLQQQKQSLRIPTILTYPGETQPKPKPDIPLIPIWFPFERRKKKGEEQAYDSYALIDATKGQKRRWIQVADNVPYQAALGFGARFVDENISSRFKVVKDEGQLNNVQDNFWDNIKNKFREFVIKKGTKIKQTNQFIEKRKFRLDSSGEVKKIQKERASALLIGRRY